MSKKANYLKFGTNKAREVHREVVKQYLSNVVYKVGNKIPIRKGIIIQATSEEIVNVPLSEDRVFVLRAVKYFDDDINVELGTYYSEHYYTTYFGIHRKLKDLSNPVLLTGDLIVDGVAYGVIQEVHDLSYGNSPRTCLDIPIPRSLDHVYDEPYIGFKSTQGDLGFHIKRRDGDDSATLYSVRKDQWGDKKTRSIPIKRTDIDELRDLILRWELLENLYDHANTNTSGNT